MLVEQHVKQHAWPEVRCVKNIYTYIYIYMERWSPLKSHRQTHLWL